MQRAVSTTAIGFILVLIAAVTIGFSYFSFTATIDTHPSDRIVLEDLPDYVSVSGESWNGKRYAALTARQEDGALILSNPGAQALAFRMSDARSGRIYDITIGETIALSGFDPRAGVTPDRASALMMDWNGRLVLRADQASSTLSIHQKDLSFRLTVLPRKGHAT